MKILVDTPIWSVVFRRRAAPGKEDGLKVEMIELIREGSAAIIGPIRQELLSGVYDETQYQKLRGALRGFPDAPIETEDYESAARIDAHCRVKGIAGSAVDFLICAIAVRAKMAIFSTDQDFERYAKVIPLQLYSPRPYNQQDR